MIHKMNHLNVLCVILYTLSTLVANLHAQLPSSIAACRRQDPQINECLLQEARKFHPEFVSGIPELGVDVLDPFHIENSEYSTSGGFNAKSKDGILNGFKDCTVEDVKIDFKKQKLIIKAFGNFSLNNKYEMKGKLLSFPLNVNGKLRLKLDNLKIKLLLDWEIVKADDGKDYIRIKRTNKDLNFGKVTFDISGFLNKDLDRTMNAVLNENWKDVISEVGGPAIDVVFVQLVKIFNKFLSKIPYDVLFPV